MSIDFDSLLEGVNKKDMRAWEELYAGYYAVLCSYVNNILRDRDQAQDIVQDVLVAVWKSSKQFGDMKELTSYLYRSCYNNALIYKRNVQIRKGIEQKIVLEAEVEFSDEIFAVTGALTEDLQKYFPNRKIYSFAPYTQIEPKEGLGTESNDHHRIVSVGRLTQRKNQLELIKAFQMLNLAGTELVFLGAWEEDYKQLCDDYIVEHNLKNVSFMGYLDDPWSEITDKDLAVFPSSMETFGLVYVESVLNGIPTILSDNAGHKSAFEYMNEQGHIYPLGDLDTLTSMISEVLGGFDQEKLEAVKA